MSQMTLDGIEAPPLPLDNLFFALMPDEKAAGQAEQLAMRIGAEHGAKPHRSARERFHITLFHVGNFAGIPVDTLATACEVAAICQVAPFALNMNKLASFPNAPGNLPYVLLCDENPELNAFQENLQTALLKRGLVKGQHHKVFTPHLTLLYGRHPLAEQKIEQVTWQARDFVLIHSLMGRGEYRILGRWPFVDAA